MNNDHQHHTYEGTSPRYVRLSEEDATHIAAYKTLRRMRQEPNRKFLLIRKDSKTIRRSIFAAMKKAVEEAGLSNLFTFNESRLEVRCITTGSSCVCCGLNDPERLKGLRSITGVWVDEADELTPAELMEIQSRIRGSEFRTILTNSSED